MKPFSNLLDTETQLLVAAGSAVAAGCIPCLETIASAALDAGVDNRKLRAAAVIGQFVKDQPAGQMKQRADELLGTHLSLSAAPDPCPLEGDAAEGRQTDTETAATGCGCR